MKAPKFIRQRNAYGFPKEVLPPSNERWSVDFRGPKNYQMEFRVNHLKKTKLTVLTIRQTMQDSGSIQTSKFVLTSGEVKSFIQMIKDPKRSDEVEKMLKISSGPVLSITYFGDDKSKISFLETEGMNCYSLDLSLIKQPLLLALGSK